MYDILDCYGWLWVIMVDFGLFMIIVGDEWFQIDNVDYFRLEWMFELQVLMVGPTLSLNIMVQLYI